MQTINENDEALEMLSEESAEVAMELINSLMETSRIKSKIIRFGIDDYHPVNKMSNRAKLEAECGHFLAAIMRLDKLNLIDYERIHESAKSKYLERFHEKYDDFIDVKDVARSLLEYVDAIPDNIDFEKTMPGIDRDWIEKVLD